MMDNTISSEANFVTISSEASFVARSASLPVNQCRASSREAFARRGIVVHPHEIKPFGRGDHAAAAAVTRVERGPQIGGVPFAGADMFERARDRAHLGVQKRARAYADLNFFAGPLDIEPFQRAHRAVRLALGSAKSREVMASNEMPRRHLHGPSIELSLDEPGMASPHRQGRAAIDDPVEIMAANRRDPRIEILGHAFGGQNGDRVRPHVRVQAIAQNIAPPILAEIDLRDLAHGMDPGIRASGAAYYDSFAAQSVKRGLDHLLHGKAIALPLPADEGPAV